MQLENDEAAVICRKCNGYLFACSRHEVQGQEFKTVSCPYNCKSEGGITTMDVPQGEQRYGRS